MDNATQSTSTPGGATAPIPDMTGQTLGEFKLLRRIGQGGMGQVYLAEQISLKRKVALKVLRPDLAANETALRRFKLEAESVARVTHANIVQVHYIGEDRGIPFMALEYVEGRNLREYITKKGPPELLIALSIMRQVAAALQRASELNIVHRDIKPENILLTRKAEVKVADFGLSRVLEGNKPALNLTQSGVTMGTPLYMSPEQVEGKPVDHRTDIYSFGATCYHMFAGEPPFRGSSAFEVALKHVKEEPPPLSSIRPDLPPELCALVHKMMAKDPAQRHANGLALLKDIARVREALQGATGHIPLATASVEAIPIPAAVPVAAPSGQRKLILLVAGTLLAACLLGLGIGWLNQRGKQPGDAEENASAEPVPANETVSLKVREQKRREMIDEMLDPASGYKDARTAILFCFSYALPLLDQPGRLDEADRVFLQLESIKKEDYSIAGKLGHGIVLALKDDWRQSTDTFLAVQKLRQPGTGLARLFGDMLGANPQLGRWLREALHRNEVNSGGDSVKLMPHSLWFPGGKGPKKDGRRPGQKTS